MPSYNTKAKAKTIATRQMLKSERMAGFRTTSSALDAIYGNLSTTQRGIGRSQTVANQKTMAALARLAGKTDRATGRIVRGSEAKAASAYGSVVAEAVDKQSGTLEAHKAAASSALKGEVGAGKVGVKGAADVLSILKAGAATAKAGAAGQLADALAYRARDDAQVVAQMQQARLDAQLQFQTWKKQQDYLKRQEEKDASGKLAGVSTYAESMTQASSGMRVILEASDGSITNRDDLVNQYIAAHGEPLDDNERAAMKVLAGNLISNHLYGGNGNRGDEVQAVMDAMHVLYPQWSGQKDKVQRVVMSGLNSVYKAADVTAQEDRQRYLDSHPEGNVAYQRDAALASVLTDSGRVDNPYFIAQNRAKAIARAIEIGMDPRVAESYVDMLINTVSIDDLRVYANTYEEDQLTNFGEAPAAPAPTASSGGSVNPRGGVHA